MLWNYEKLINTYADRLPDPMKGTEAAARLAAQTYLSHLKDEATISIRASAYVAFCAAAETRRQIAIGRNKLLTMRPRLKTMKQQGLEATDALCTANDKMVAALATGSLSVADIQDFAQKAAAFAQAIKSLK